MTDRKLKCCPFCGGEAKDPLQRLREGAISVYLGRELADDIEAAYIRLPRDADDVPIRPVDKVVYSNDAPVTVDSIGTSRCYAGDFGFFASSGAFFGQGTLERVRHVRAETPNKGNKGAV